MTVIIGLGTPRDPYALKLETRARRFIKNVLRPEVNPVDMRLRVRMIQDIYPYNQLVSASAIYNCYGMVFAARRSAIVGEDDVNAILNDDGYHELPWSPATWLVGDVVIYRNDQGELTHVGVIARKTPNLQDGTIAVDVLSTWGDSGEYLHPMDVVHPLLGKPVAVVSQRFQA